MRLIKENINISSSWSDFKRIAEASRTGEKRLFIPQNNFPFTKNQIFKLYFDVFSLKMLPNLFFSKKFIDFVIKYFVSAKDSKLDENKILNLLHNRYCEVIDLLSQNQYFNSEISIGGQGVYIISETLMKSLSNILIPSETRNQQGIFTFNLYNLNNNNLFLKLVINEKQFNQFTGLEYKSTNIKKNTSFNQIFYGPPGTGKTHNSITKSLDIIGLNYNGYNDAKSIFNKQLGNNIEFITFHQSYSYEDFIQGIKPVLKSKVIENEDEEISNNSKLEYELKIGVFKELCERAKEQPNDNFVLIIDEINRGNISKIFGELITLIEDTKRINILDESKGLKLTLPNSENELFGVPDNLYIIGTMNTADKSITNIDTALRRRFKFIEFPPENKHPEFKILKYYDNQEEKEFSISNLMINLNKRLEVLLDKDHLIGHTYFLGKDSWENIIDTMNLEIIPLLNEYFYNDWDKISLVLGDNFRKETYKIITKKEVNLNKLFNQSNNDDLIDNSNYNYSINNYFTNFNKESDDENNHIILEFIKGFSLID